MTDEELAILLHKTTRTYKYMDQGGWADEVKHIEENPDKDLWAYYVHRTYLENVRKIIARLEGEVPREIIEKVIGAL